MSNGDARPPPCSRCGFVEPARTTKRHVCHPVALIAMQVGYEGAVIIGRAVVRALCNLRFADGH